MTTKFKIIIGFIVMILVTGVVAGIGYFSLSNATGAFTEYRRLARLNVRTSDIVANQFDAAASVRSFRLSAEPEAVKSALDALKKNQTVIAESKDLTAKKETQDALFELDRNILDQVQTINALQSAITSTLRHYETEMRPAARELSQTLVNMIQVFQRTPGNEDIINGLAATLDQVAACRASFGRLAASRTQALAAESGNLLGELGKTLDGLRMSAHTEQGRVLFSGLERSYSRMTSASTSMRESALENIRQAERLSELNNHVAQIAVKISADVNTQMTEQGTRTLAVNSTAQMSTLAFAIGGLILGILLASVTIVSLARVLRGMSSFAGAIASGDFAAQVNIREKGEVGQTLAAMRQIPQVLESLAAETYALADSILGGQLRKRLDSRKFAGSFGDMTKTINAVGDAYTSIVDELSSPVMCCDKERNVLFLNRQGQRVMGGDLTGRPCAAGVKSEHCADKCFGLRAMQEKNLVNDETTMCPCGNAMQVDVSATPLYNMKREVSGFMEVLTDLTEIRSQQALMTRVAAQAAAISDRVAAASEELSAQVEQVSRGADMQRNRVESTASAMTEMNSTVLEVAKNAGEASEQSEMTKNKAKDGATLVDEVVNSINLMNQVAVNLQSNMRELGTQAEDIGGVIDVIADIADQTNLLALNAAIEAARAGEAGRGFAVVADEVRKLAEKTMTATHEVGANITAIQNSTRVNIEEVNTAARAITEATGLANNSGQALSEIVSLASASSSVVTSIATAAEEQSATSEEINQAIDEINRIVSETADGMIQSAAAVQELSRMAQELNTVMAELHK